MPFLRFTRDRRGYENTFLLHAAHPNDRPRVLYWYRSAPGVRVGRPALDEDAIRTIEEQHPELDFDWPHILEVGAATPPEIEQRRQVRARRKGAKAREEEAAAESAATVDIEGPTVAPVEVLIIEEPRVDIIQDVAAAENEPEPEPSAPPAHDLLEELVGREIATRLRARYAEMTARLHQIPESDPQREAFHLRVERLDPDGWVTPEEILRGINQADEAFDVLRRDLLTHVPHASKAEHDGHKEQKKRSSVD